MKRAGHTPLKLIRHLLLDIRHGLTLKLIALGSRALFLVFVAPRLVVGELGQYVFMSTLAVLASRVLSLGLEDQLPMRVAGKVDEVALFTPVLALTLIVEFVLAGVFVVTGESTVAASLLTICYVTTSFFAGLVRSVDVASSERLRDLHWPVFVSLGLAPVSWSASQLLAIMASSLMAVQLLEVKLLCSPASLVAIPWGVLRATVLSEIGKAWRKLFASATLLMMIRGIVVWPTLLMSSVNLDEIAYALLIGEAFWQSCMVLVYRRYAHYCRLTHLDGRALKRDALNTSSFLLGYSLLAAIAVYSLRWAGIKVGAFSAWPSAAALVLFFGMMSCYLLLRYLTWVFRDFDWTLTGLEVSLIVAEGVLIFALDEQYWINALVLACGAFLLAVALYVMSTEFVEPKRTHPTPEAGGAISSGGS